MIHLVIFRYINFVIGYEFSVLLIFISIPNTIMQQFLTQEACFNNLFLTLSLLVIPNINTTARLYLFLIEKYGTICQT